MGLIRNEDWPEQFVQVLKRKQDIKFKYGEHDCCMSACDVVLAMTGIDLAEDFRGYSGKSEAKEVLKEHGGVEQIAETMARKHAIVEITENHAQRGDVVFVKKEKVLGVIDSSGTKIAVPGKVGWRYLPKSHGSRFWRI